MRHALYWMKSCEIVEGRLYTMLEASCLHPISLDYRLNVGCTNNCNRTTLQNLWLLSLSIHKAFRAGHVEVTTRRRAFSQASDECESDEISQNAAVSNG
jgi:hypothetical protein